MPPLPPSGSLKIAARDWPSDSETLSLIDDVRGYRTMLWRANPGPLGLLHAHDEIEQIYVLDGDFFDDEASYGPGDFVLRMPGTQHRAGSKNGCTMLITYMPLEGTKG